MKPYQQFQDEEGNYTKEFEDFYEAVEKAGCANFDCNQVARAILERISVEEAVKQFNKDNDEIEVEDFEDYLNHDTSMN